VAIEIGGIDHVHLHVSDVDRALRFYRAFGAEEALRVGDRLVFLRLPRSRDVIALDGRAEHERNPAHVGLPLAGGGDLDVAIEAVVAAGGHLVERGEHAPGVVYAYVGDPDGNVIEL
jgi:catechol 2,3-dioxygenase-like lactoylglutathione lyase family enzyme